MSDMLVNLLKLPALDESMESLRNQDVIIRRAYPWEMTQLIEFVRRNFTQGWADEVSVGYSRQPVSIFIAIRDAQVVGFSAYECTCRGFFGPIGVAASERGKGIGKALLLAGLCGLKEMGYAYGIIGAAADRELYERTVGAVEIAGSAPGIYAAPLLRHRGEQQA